MTTKTALAALLIAGVLLAGSFSRQSIVPPPDAEFAGTTKKASAMPTSYPGLVGSLTYNMLDKRIDISWLRNFVAENTRELSVQSEPISLWPTEVCSFGINKLCVAGKNIKGQTVIRLWEFSASVELEEPYPDPVSGDTVYPDTFIPVSTTSTLYIGNIAGRRLVRAMFNNHGASNKLFVQFHDSRDLYELDASTGSLTIKVSTTNEPLLARNYLNRSAYDHATYGYLYSLSMDVNENGAPESLIFVDSDRNGTLELASTMHLVGAADWKQAFLDQTLLQQIF